MWGSNGIEALKGEKFDRNINSHYTAAIFYGVGGHSLEAIEKWEAANKSK